MVVLPDGDEVAVGLDGEVAEELGPVVYVFTTNSPPMGLPDASNRRAAIP